MVAALGRIIAAYRQIVVSANEIRAIDLGSVEFRQVLVRALVAIASALLCTTLLLWRYLLRASHIVTQNVPSVWPMLPTNWTSSIDAPAFHLATCVQICVRAKSFFASNTFGTLLWIIFPRTTEACCR